MSQPITFQSLIMALERFWADHGCLLWQPYYAQVGAGTMNPATFLRVLGPEPWNVAYVEPSIRPDDGRYGQNPNRFQQHYQYQVILKPDPGNPQDLYLASLEAIGIDLRQHDVRFVEDNWEAPALGAWGLGWEVWLDGQEITQFTYFQQAGGLICDPVSVELTYGLERILIALRNADAIWDEPWDDRLTYGEVNRQGEFEHSKYYFELADVNRLRQMYDLFAAEARAALAAGMVLPAYDYVLKCSHAFNVLDTRGAIGVTERAGFFGAMRGLAREVAEAYVAQRERLEYPLLRGGDGKQTSAVPSRPAAAAASQPATVLLEVGTEELPAADLDSALAQLRDLAPAMLAEARLAHGELQVYGTPRRLALLAREVAPRQPDVERVVRGPAADRAYDNSGRPTPAAIGFAKKNGVPVEALETRELDAGQYVVAVVRESGQPALDVLRSLLPRLIGAVRFEKSMRWDGEGVAFARPIRWLAAMQGEHVIPFAFAGVEAGDVTRGLRPLGSPLIRLKSADEYLDVMRASDIAVDPARRREAIEAGAKGAAAEVGGQALVDPDLLAEVSNLVEQPTPLVGEFSAEYLALPREVLISVMKKHQRYFPVEKDGRLLPYFIAIRNGDDQGLELVRQGNEHVIRARFADAAYFVGEDIKQPLEAYRPRLGTLTFQAKLGSMLDKAERIEKLAGTLATMLGLDGGEKRDALRAARLCKADLVTKMVVEMTSLQGLMGAEYALRGGENQAVAAAIGEHYQTVPGTRPGLAVALADRLDSLAGLFALGLVPSGTKDPFGLRRAALGVVQPLIDRGVDFDLRVAVRAAGARQPLALGDEVYDQILEFIAGRLRVLLLEAGYRYDVVDAVLAEQGHDPHRCQQSVIELSSWVARPDWSSILPAYARCVRITRDQPQRFDVVPAAFSMEAERALWEAYQAAPASLESVSSADGFLTAFMPLIPAINRFFDEVLVMDDDRRTRENRLGLLQKIAAMAQGVADLSKLEGF